MNLEDTVQPVTVGETLRELNWKAGAEWGVKPQAAELIQENPWRHSESTVPAF